MPGTPDPMAHAESRGAPPRTAQRLVAVPWRHAGLIALCTILGGLVSTTWWLGQPQRHAAAANTRMQATRRATPALPLPGVPAIGLRLDMEPAPAAAVDAAIPAADAAPLLGPAAALRLDAARELDAIDAALRVAPPAAGHVRGLAPDPAPATADERRDATLPGLVAGLLLGLLVAGLRELRGERMRSPREAEWALGAPVLGAIPTLSARARGAFFEPRMASPDGAPEGA